MHRALYPVITALAAVLLAPAAASAWTTIDGVSDPLTAKLYRDWQAASQIPTPQVTIPIQEEGCEDAVVCVLLKPQITLVFPDPLWLWSDDEPTRARDRLLAQGTFYHELTHVRDYQPRKTHRYRDRFAQIMGWRPLKTLKPKERAYYDENPMRGVYESWTTCITLPSGECVAPAETFAMAGEWCSINSRNRTPDDWASGYGYAPTLAQHRAACRLLAAPLR
jgi:hypothetical protein